MLSRARSLAKRVGRAFGGGLYANLSRDKFQGSASAHPTAQEITTSIDLTGKTALVTGCDSGIGYETMRVLALRGANVLGTARTAEKGHEACASVEGHCSSIVLELTDFDSIVDCANQVDAMSVPIDILICNAGILHREHGEKNGIELHFLVNHLGHFLLTRRLLNRVLAAPQGRVVITGSSAHLNVPDQGIYFDDISGRSWSTPGYDHSKLANGLFSLGLAQRLEGTNATSNCVHPGSVVTNIFRHSNVPWDKSSKHVKSIAQGAATTCYVATSPDLAGVNGRYFRDCKLATPSHLMRDVRLANRLWDFSSALVADYL